jgi:hypothetical protein
MLAETRSEFSKTAELFPYNRHNLLTDSILINVEQQQKSGFRARIIRQQEMRMSLQTKSPRGSAYAPMDSNPLRLASVTVQAVDQMGAITAGEIEKTAEEIILGATEIADKLRELADTIRRHTEIASEHVESFCSKAACVFEGIVELQEKLRLNAHKPEAEEAEGESLPVPEFLTARPAEISEGDAGVVPYVPLDADPLQQASERIASVTAAALGEPIRSRGGASALRRAAQPGVGAK